MDRLRGLYRSSLLGNDPTVDVHSLAFIAALRAYPEWRMIWFMPVVIVEGGLFGAILYLLFGVENISTRKRRNNQAN